MAVEVRRGTVTPEQIAPFDLGATTFTAEEIKRQIEIRRAAELEVQKILEAMPRRKRWLRWL